ncbi:MAG: HAD-IA family hydrolase [Pseudomonadota bacterium]
MTKLPATAVLFDLDGTLIDTAADLVAALYAACDRLGQQRPAYEAARRRVGYGGVGLTKLAFGDDWQPQHDEALQLLLEYYGDHIAEHSALFPGLADLLRTLDHAHVPWGIVTNKPQHLTLALLQALDMQDRTSCVVGADTLPVRKPDPAPLVYGAGLLGVPVQHCVYIGDHQRDIVAARKAHMHCIAAAYGYIDDGDDPQSWQADKIALLPTDITLCLDAFGIALPKRRLTL